MIGAPRSLLKSAALAVATALVAPALAWFWASGRVLGRDRALQNASQGLALLPGLAGQYLRRAFLVRALDHCHSSATIEFGALFSKAGARLEEDVYVGPMCHIGLAHIGRGTLLAAGVHVPSGARMHGIDDPEVPIRDQPGRAVVVRIGANCWIGSGSIIMADVGEGTVIGAGSVVTRPLPARVVAAGVPASVKKARGPASDPRDDWSREPGGPTAVGHP